MFSLVIFVDFIYQILASGNQYLTHSTAAFFVLNPVENTVASTGFALLRPKRIEDSDYLFGIICNKQFTLELEMLAYGAAYPAISTDDICNISVYVPNEDERDRISRLLANDNANGNDNVNGNDNRNDNVNVNGRI